MRVFALAAVLVTLLVSLLVLVAGRGPDRRITPKAAAALAGKVLPPQKGIYHTAFPDFCPEEDCVSTGRVRDFEALVGRDLAWAAFSDNWFDGIHFPYAEATAIQAAGAVPYIRMMPRGSWAKGCQDQAYPLQDLAYGRFDQELRAYAESARDYRGPLLLDFSPEANGDWFPWSGVCLGGGRKDGYGDSELADGPEIYVAAWRHLQSLFAEADATNVTFVWHLDADGAEGDWNTLAAYYPGGVDWAGLSAYGADRPGEAVALAPQLDEAWPKLARLHAGPLALLEFGTTAGAGQAGWLKAALAALPRYQRLQAIGWWHSDWQNEDGSYSKLRLDSSPKTLAVYRAGVRDFAVKVRLAQSP